jgi:hypothetical protein
MDQKQADTLTAGAESYIKIPVNNPGSDTVNILNSEVSCGCSKITFSSSTVCPQSFVIMTLKILPDSDSVNKVSIITAAVKTDKLPQINTINYRFFAKANNQK